MPTKFCGNPFWPWLHSIIIQASLLIRSVIILIRWKHAGILAGRHRHNHFRASLHHAKEKWNKQGLKNTLSICATGPQYLFSN